MTHQYVGCHFWAIFTFFDGVNTLILLFQCCPYQLETSSINSLQNCTVCSQNSASLRLVQNAKLNMLDLRLEIWVRVGFPPLMEKLEIWNTAKIIEFCNLIENLEKMQKYWKIRCSFFWIFALRVMGIQSVCKPTIWRLK